MTIGFRAIQGLYNIWYAGIMVPFAINDFEIYSLFLYIYSKEGEKADFHIVIGWNKLYWNNKIQVNGFVYIYSMDSFNSLEKYDGK